MESVIGNGEERGRSTAGDTSSWPQADIVRDESDELI